MGDVADLAIDGIICEKCGEFIDENGIGVPRLCESCKVEKKDLSEGCDFNDENKDNDCWNCLYFLFPVGCMYFEGERDEH